MNLSDDSSFVRACKWLIHNEMACYVAGIIFSVPMIVGLCFWISGKNAEPLTFAFSLLMSFAFAAPATARRIVAEKPLESMSYEELLDLVARTRKPSWKCVTDYGVEEYLYLPDPRLRIKHFSGDEGTQNEDFKEGWANDHPDPRAYGLWFDLYFAGERLRRNLLVAVDGCRAYLPCPKAGTMIADDLTGKIAEIVNHDSELYARYLDSAGIVFRKNSSGDNE